MLKKITIFKIALLAVHILFFIFLAASQTGAIFFEDSFIFALLLLAISGPAFFVSFVSYKACTISGESKIHILFLGFYTLGITFLLRAISGPDFNFFQDYIFIFPVLWHYGLFLSILLLSGLALPILGNRKKICLYKTPIFIIFHIIYLTSCAFLAYSPGIAQTLIEFSNFFDGITGALLFLLIIFLLQQYRETKNKFLINLIVGFAFLINAIIISFFSREWTFIWWYSYIIILLGFFTISIGLEKSQRKGANLEKVFESATLYSRIGTKLVISFLSVAILSIFVTGYSSYSTAKKNLKDQVLGNLHLFSQTKKAQLLSFLDELREGAIILAQDELLTQKIIFYQENQENNEAINKLLKENQSVYAKKIYQTNIINPNGIVIASTQSAQIGTDKSSEVYFARAKNFEYGEAYLSDMFIPQGENQELSLVSVSPVQNKQTGKTIAFLANYIKSDKIQELIALTSNGFAITEGGGLEVYLINRDNALITQTSFRKSIDFEEKILSLPVIRCKYGDEIDEIYNDYRGISVVGSSACLNNGWTLLVETGEEEIFTGLEIIKLKIVLASMFVMAIVLIVVYFLVKKITDPIKELSQAAQRISGGDLSARADVTSKGEIGTLAKSFNQMTESLINASDYVKNMIKIMPTALIVINANGRITDVNVAAQKILGYSEQELIDKKINKLFSTESIALNAILKDIGLGDLASRKSIENQRTFLVDSKNEKIPALLSASVIAKADKSGDIRSIIFIAKDLRELTDYAKKRLSTITPVLEKIASGDFSHKIEIPKDQDEFSDHLIALNIMIGDFKKMVSEIREKGQELEEQYKKLEITSEELQEAKSDLERKVQERTLELQSKVLELERFNKIAVGREIKMVELKDNIKALKKELKDAKKSKAARKIAKAKTKKAGKKSG